MLECGCVTSVGRYARIWVWKYCQESSEMVKDDIENHAEQEDDFHVE